MRDAPEGGGPILRERERSKRRDAPGGRGVQKSREFAWRN
jgi:hypothetical protein